ncbi:hypothetical protein MHBO_003664 [Bonamia ostreae]|uniref:Uncharacterized protein n=1 Tax=Bonamia ostreae TaxID=126728 RepID=A0ABV2ARH8_9EUKA
MLTYFLTDHWEFTIFSIFMINLVAMGPLILVTPPVTFLSILILTAYFLIYIYGIYTKGHKAGNLENNNFLFLQIATNCFVITSLPVFYVAFEHTAIDETLRKVILCFYALSPALIVLINFAFHPKQNSPKEKPVKIAMMTSLLVLSLPVEIIKCVLSKDLHYKFFVIFSSVLLMALFILKYLSAVANKVEKCIKSEVLNYCIRFAHIFSIASVITVLANNFDDSAKLLLLMPIEAYLLVTMMSHVENAHLILLFISVLVLGKIYNGEEELTIKDLFLYY